MGPSFTGEAAQDRDCGDHSSHPGGASSRIPRTLNITPSSITNPMGPKAIFRDGMSARGANLLFEVGQGISALSDIDCSAIAGASSPSMPRYLTAFDLGGL
jgi:hypothetical protein